MPKKTPSPLHQVIELFKPMLAAGESRHEAKRQLKRLTPRTRGGIMTVKVYGFGTYRRERQAAIQFAKWCSKTFKIRYLTQITPDMTRAYFAWRKEQGRKANTLAADLTGIRRLNLALQLAEPGHASLVPPDVKAPRQRAPRGAYSQQEAEMIIDYVRRRDELAGLVLRLQLEAGLRISEAIWLRPDCIDVERGEIRVEVIGKGGKPRRVAVSSAILEKLDLSDRTPLRPPVDDLGSRTMDTSQARRIEDLVRRACRVLGITPHGTHGFRAAAARWYFSALTLDGKSNWDALKATAIWLGHGANRLDVLRLYLGDDLVDDVISLDEDQPSE